MTTIDPPPPSAIREYFCQEDGLTFTVRLYQTPSGGFEAKIIVYEGSADFNALYWGDSVDDGNSFAFGGSDQNLNMTGAGQVSHSGEPVDWDTGIKLSSPGRAGGDKPTYLTEGEYFTVALDGITSLDQIEDIGVRATSTSTPEGSIKCVLEPINNDDDAEDEHDDALADDVNVYELSHETALQQEPVAMTEVAPATEEPAAEEPAEVAANADYFAAFYNFIATDSEASEPPAEEEVEEPELLLL